jgi:hypothetical protein
LQFKGIVVKKEQGRSGIGDVVETLFVEKPKFRATKLFHVKE